jgi:DNA repair protein RecN (Recombination protein N)
MLRELHISNLAVIADARVEFDGGLNCFTGATGAGKSLVIGAIELLLGLRSPADMLRSGAEEARVSGVFEIADPLRLRRLDAITDLPLSTEGGEVLLARRIHASGRTSSSVNGNPVTLQMLKAIGELLVDIHGQHDQQFLLRPSNQLEVLDRFGSAEALRSTYHDTWVELVETRTRLEQLSAGTKLRDQQLDLLRFQADELDRAELDPAEFVELEARSAVLANLDRLRRETGSAYAALYDADGSIVDRLKAVASVLIDAGELDASLKPVVDAVRSGLITLEEAAFDLHRYTQRLDLDPGELSEVNERLNTINRVLRKYGRTVEEAIEFRAGLGREIDQLTGQSVDATVLQKAIASLEPRVKSAAKELSARRTDAARKLTPLIEAQLAHLGMDKARFRVELTASEPGSSGADVVEFVVQTNPGLAPAPLRKVASGGEIGRIMLAIKSVLAATSSDAGQPGASVLVFDEIDANIGGRLGSVIGSKLRELAGRHQVLCITHLPQIAAYASRHLTVRKQQGGGATVASVRPVAGEDRVDELAEMIGGARLTDVSRAQARELLSQASTETGQPAQTQPARPAQRARPPKARDVAKRI